MEANQTVVLKRKILKLMLQLALPSVLAQIVNVLYNIIDRIYR